MWVCDGRDAGEVCDSETYNWDGMILCNWLHVATFWEEEAYDEKTALS